MINWRKSTEREKNKMTRQEEEGREEELGKSER